MSRNASHRGQLTIRFDAELDRELRARARADGVSLNQAAIALLRRATGLTVETHNPRAIGDALDHLAGTWTASEAKAFERATRALEQLDDELWRRK